MTVTEFLLARLAEDETTASLFEAAEQPKWQLTVWPHDGDPIPLEAPAFSAARVLAQCAAMRKIVEESLALNGEYAGIGLSAAVRALASIWSDHPDFRQEWA